MEKWMETVLESYERALNEQERSRNTIEKYLRDAAHFLTYVGKETYGQKEILLYKEQLQKRYKVNSVNSMLIAVNSFLRFQGKGELCVRSLRQQRLIFREEERALNRREYGELVHMAKVHHRERLCCILQTVGSTGIRIGELQFVTVEALEEKRIHISSKGKNRVVPLPGSLIELLKNYCHDSGISHGPVFITRTGHLVDRRNIWAEMKRLCEIAGIRQSKVFPHNLRHLFATSFYEKEHDLVRLADYLGHSNVETTRRYTMISSMEACMRQLELGMVTEKDPFARQ